MSERETPAPESGEHDFLPLIPVEGERALATLGAESRPLLDFLGGGARLTLDTLRHLGRGHLELTETIRQCYLIGVRSTSLALLTGSFTGMVFALQFMVALERFGASETVGHVVSVAIFRELGPVLTCLMVGGRVASGMAAEIGSMKVTEQIDALRALGADPVRKLVVPRVVAGFLMLPLLTVMADVVGILGALGIAWVEKGLSAVYFYTSVVESNQIFDVVSGLIKTFAFGFLAAIAGCYQGMQTSGGTEGVGQSTTRTVVLVSVSIFVADFLLTKIMIMLPG